MRRDPFLVPPSTGYSEILDPELSQRLERAYGALIRGGMSAEALAVARELQNDPAMAPAATVLAAQTRYLAGSCVGAIEELAALVIDRPRFVAAQLLLGRCRQELGDLPGAAASYWAIASLNPVGAAELERISARALDVAVDRIRGWIAGRREEEARAALGELQDWAPRDATTLSAVRELAEALGDDRLELGIVRSLVAQGGAGRAMLERQAQLELEVGDAADGLAILEQLRLQYPDDSELVRELERARFAWRLTMLPEAAREVVTEPELDRGELAALLYWVFPSVRYTRPAKAVIANDVLDEPSRTEIVRVVNLGIMAIDPSLHAFRPRDPARRSVALLGLLRVLQQGGDLPTCFEGASAVSELSVESICALSSRCGLLDEPAECLPDATLSGATAMSLARRAALRLERP